MMDSVTVETLLHREKVAEFIGVIVDALMVRGEDHDDSKLQAPEVDIFAEFTPKLKDSTYGSDEYKQFLAAMKPALDHHYKVNRHHPEHFENGVRGMNLVDLVEMLCDWKAATLRHTNGDIMRSIDINQKRFGYSDELADILRNTVRLFEESEKGVTPSV